MLGSLPDRGGRASGPQSGGCGSSVTAHTDPRGSSDAAESSAARERPLILRVLASDAFIGTVSVLVFVALWEYVGGSELVNPLFTSSPSRILKQAVAFAATGLFVGHIQTSLFELLIGFIAAAVIAVPVSIVAGWSRIAYAVLNPYIGIGYVMPRIALVPLLTLWFGIGLTAKVALVIIMVVFPVMIVVIEGVRKVDADLIRLARAFGAGSGQIFRTIILPASVPYIIAGLKIGYGLGVVGIVVGELYGSTSGLGFVLVSAGAVYNTDLMFVSVFTLVVIGVSGMALLSLIESRFSRWRQTRG